ncbi:hypothetical protein [Microseira wollei]|uniref:Uncharacterized protein n=1 Tax=Microseira wollei NIES-4236 TaxID=2530354 RepID=A0AAV3X2Z6_9CYAN|nr:hypothetical protein [Microseira wollei]GET35653.1 hypothetical protein MiSe_03950 [Microseira wollei NIES-4236]
MTDIRKLINQIAAQEAQLHHTQFLAPCVRSGFVRTKVSGIICTFTPKPRNFEGWGIFQPISVPSQSQGTSIAELVDEPNLPQLAEYLKLLPAMRLRLAYSLQGKTWLAYPINESDAKQRIGIAKPVAVNLVTEGVAFECAIARYDGHTFWFEELDRRADPIVAENLRQAFKKQTPTPELRFKGITPEMRTAYDLATQRIANWQQKRDEKRLAAALKQGGGNLEKFSDRTDHWLVEWTTANGEHHTSAITKNDLTVISSGICLSGRDRDFDLQSLVGVIENFRF